MIALVITLFAACKKESSVTNSANNNNTSQTTGKVLLTEIIDNNPNDKDYLSVDTKDNTQADSVSTGYGQPVFQFTYSGKQLTKLVHYLSSKYYQTTLFAYSTNGNLASTSSSLTLNGQVLTNAELGDSTAVTSQITYTNGSITEQKYYNINNTLYDDVTYTWQNGLIQTLTDNPSGLADYLGYTNTYQYNSEKNSSAITINPGGAINILGFDDQKNLALAFPFWWVILGPDATEANFAFGGLGTNNNDDPSAFVIPVIPGENNPLKDDLGNTYTYQYNMNGYPSEETVTNGGVSGSVKYQYIQVN